MNEDLARWLLTTDGESLTQAAYELRQARAEAPQALNRLRKAASPEQAGAAWELADLRLRGRAKFGADASRLFFVREALEQASSARAASHHALRLLQAGVVSVADVCGGIGGDALAFARSGIHVTLYEQDPVRALFASANADALGLTGRVQVVRADVTAQALDSDAVWFDPARRTERGRRTDPQDYQPPLSTLTQWTGKSVGVKLSPAIPHEVAEQYGAELEFLSDGGECKEALLWLGGLSGGVTLQATLLTDSGRDSLAVNPTAVAPVADSGFGHFLYEPDAAVIRAHGVGTLASQLGAHLAAPQIAYLLADTFIPSPFASAYEIVERFSYSRRRLQESLHRRNIGEVVIKKRGFPQEPDVLRKEWKLRGSEAITVVLTRAADGPGHQVLLCRPVTVGQ